MSDALFAYGSLRSRVEHPMLSVLREHGTPAGAARLRGRLYVVDWYPGIVLDTDAGWVVGELWVDLDPDAWPVLDFYEGCSAEDPAPHEYVRRLTTVQADSGEREAWVYDYARDVASLTEVLSGDWLKR